MYHIKDDKRAIQSSQWIYDALVQLMNIRDFDDITVADLTEQAKVGRTTFYRAFDSIEDVLMMKCDEKFRDFSLYLVEYFQSRNQNIEPPFIVPFLRFWYVNPTILKLINKANKSEIIKKSFLTMISQLKNSIDFTQFIPEENRSYFVEIRFAMFSTILNEWIRNDMNVPPDELATSLAEGLKTCINLDKFI